MRRVPWSAAAKLPHWNSSERRQLALPHSKVPTLISPGIIARYRGIADSSIRIAIERGWVYSEQVQDGNIEILACASTRVGFIQRSNLMR